MRNKISQEQVIRELMHSLDNLKKDAYKSVEKIWKHAGYKPEPYSSIDIIDICVMLMFGESKYDENITKKIDFNKNKNLIKNTLLSMGFDSTIEILREILNFADNFISKFSDRFKILMNSDFKDSETILTEDEVIRLYDFIFGLSWMSTHTISNLSSMSSIYHNIESHPISTTLKKDSLKRYYFNHVYDLKNNVKIFDKEKMFFGETNAIMSFFDSVCDYIFGDFITTFNSLDTIFKDLAK